MINLPNRKDKSLSASLIPPLMKCPSVTQLLVVRWSVLTGSVLTYVGIMMMIYFSTSRQSIYVIVTILILSQPRTRSTHLCKPVTLSNDGKSSWRARPVSEPSARQFHNSDGDG